MIHLEDFDVTYNMCILSHSSKELKLKLNRLHYGRHIGLRVKVAKIKLMRFNTKRSDLYLFIEGEQNDKVESFCYFGGMIAKDGSKTVYVSKYE